MHPSSSLPASALHLPKLPPPLQSTFLPPTPHILPASPNAYIFRLSQSSRVHLSPTPRHTMHTKSLWILPLPTPCTLSYKGSLAATTHTLCHLQNRFSFIHYSGIYLSLSATLMLLHVHSVTSVWDNNTTLCEVGKSTKIQYIYSKMKTYNPGEKCEVQFWRWHQCQERESERKRFKCWVGESVLPSPFPAGVPATWPLAFWSHFPVWRLSLYMCALFPISHDISRIQN